MKRLHLLLIVTFLLYSSIAFAIQDVNCDTSDDRGNEFCIYTGITAWPPFPSYTRRGDENPSTQEEQDSFGTGGFYTELVSSGVDVSFGGGAMDWYGESCDNPYKPSNCVGVDVTAIGINCVNGNGNTESTPVSGDPCPDDQCKFLVQKSTTFPRRTTKARCNFLSTTPVGKDYYVYFTLAAYVYDAYNKRLVLRTFTDAKTYQLGCTNYQGCTGGRTCVSIGERTECWCIDQTGSCQSCIKKSDGQNCDCNEECSSGNCDGGICQAACQCTSGECCDGCNYKLEGEQPTGKTDGYTGSPFCLGKDIYQTYRDWKCTGSSSTSTYDDTNKLKNSCPEICWNGECKPYKMKILFLPVNWGTGETNFNQEAEKQARFFLDHLPTECGDEVGTDWKFTNCVIDESSFCGWCTPFFGDAGHAVDKLKDCANKKHYEYNYVVGLMNHHYNCPNDDGVGYSCGKQAVIAEKSDVIMSSHELGHEFGLKDEYNKFLANVWWSPNPLSIEYGCDPNSNCEGNLCCCGRAAGFREECTGWYPWEGKNLCCLGNKHAGGGRSIMSFSDPDDIHHMTPRGFEQSCLNQIKGDKGLKCT